MSDDSTNVQYDEPQRKTVRMHPPTLRALDRLVEESDEWGNASDAIRGLIREADNGNVAADGGAPDTKEEHTPDDSVLATVYEAALDYCNDEFVLDEDRLGTVAQAINNDPDTGITPSEKDVAHYLRRLTSKGFAYQKFRAISMSEGVTRWLIKPAATDPELWHWNPEKVEERQKRQKEKRTEFIETIPSDD